MTLLPNGWKTATIAETCDILDNKRKPLNSAQRLEMKGTVPYYGANGVVDYINDFIFDEELILMAEDGGNFSDYLTRPIAYKVQGKSWVNNHAHVLRAKPQFNQDYLFYALEHKDIQPVLNGGTRAKLNKSELERIELLLPASVEEQHQIAAILTAVDDKLDVIARQVEATQTLKQGLMQTLFSRGFGTQHADGRWVPHTEFKDTDQGRAPAIWSVQALEQVAVVERGKFSARPRNDPKYFEGGDIPFVQTGDVAKSGRLISTASQFLNEAGLGVSKLFEPGTIFLTIAANIGDVAIAAIPMACPDSVVGIRAVAGACDPAWLYYLLSANKGYFDSRATQNAQKNINLQVLRPFRFAMPPPAEQAQIGLVLTALDEKLESLSERLHHNQTLKRGLMQKLLTGEWRVKVDADIAA